MKAPGPQGAFALIARVFATSRVLGAIVVATTAASPFSAAASGSLRVVHIAPERTASASLDPFEAALSQNFGFTFDRVVAGTSTHSGPSLVALRVADAAIVHRGPGPLTSDDAVLLRAFLSAGKPLVLIAATPDAWPTEPRFASDVLGATAGPAFAAGAPLTIINLFPHPILTGVERFEMDQPIPVYTKLGEDAQMIMEGTVGEATAPLAWVRRGPALHVAHFVFGHAQLLGDPAYQRMVGQAVLWAAQRPIPAAQAAVQRTFMPDSFPGAFAITLPNGPGVCLDPVRGGINYVWAGDFVDLRPRWITKQGEPARIFEPVFYREKAWQPFRAGSPDAKPDFHFRGYTFRDGLPEFHYRIGDRDVFETLSGGRVANALIRRFRVGPGKSPLWLDLEPQADAVVVVRGLEQDGPLASFTSAAGGEFTIEIRPKSTPAP